MSDHAWEQIVKEIELECDPCKLKELASNLNEAMLAEERAKVSHRLGITSNSAPFVCSELQSRVPAVDVRRLLSS